MKHSIFAIVLCISILFTASVVSAEVPKIINYQGRLTNSSGDPVANGDYQIKFKFYGSIAGDDSLWSSGFQTVPVSNGLFNYRLGENVTIPTDLFGPAGESFLGITIETDPEMTPRTKISSSAFSWHSLTSDTADVAIIATISQDISCTGCVTTTEIANGTILFEDLSQNGAGADQIIKWNGSAWALGNDEIGGPGSGDISAVYAGNGLLGGGETGDVSIDIDSAYIDAFIDTSNARYADSASLASTARFADSTDAITDGAVDLADIGPNGAAADQIMKWNGSAWIPANDEIGGPEIGDISAVFAGNGLLGGGETGDVNMDIDSEWVDIFIDSSDARYADSSGFADSTDAITDGAVDLADIGPNGAAVDQIIKWSGTAWIPANDETGSSGDEDWTQYGNILHTFGEWGIARAGNSLIGDHDSTHTTFGVACTTGSSAVDAKYVTVGGGYSNVASYDGATVGGGYHSTAGGTYATVAGGFDNEASGVSSTVGGGNLDTASGNWSFVGGGYSNVAYGTFASVSGGQYNKAGEVGEEGGTIGGGYFNTASGQYSTVAGGYFSTASGDSSTVSGGADNNASGLTSTVSGGATNTASGRYSTISGGEDNTADSSYAAVGGGLRNTASGETATIGGGYENIASGNTATIGGGHSNTVSASSIYATVSGGRDNTASKNWSTVGGGFENTASGKGATVSGGYGIITSGDFSTVAGGWVNTASDTAATVSGGYDNTASGKYSSIGGGYDNTASGDSSSIAGGISNYAGGTASAVGGGYADSANGFFSMIGGGWVNQASNFCATVCGGGNNIVNGPYSTVCGGGVNSVYGGYSVIAGGYANSVNGNNSMVPGGEYCDADSSYSFAAGRRAKAVHDGAFVWGDHTDADFTSTASDQFLIRASGGVGININNPAYALDVNGDINVAGSYNVKKGGTNYSHPDYVFEPDYELMSLEELKEYVLKHKHLPNVISADEVKQNDGFKLDELLIQMLEKIEEQTLYIIQLDESLKEIDELKLENENLKAQITHLTKLTESMLTRMNDAENIKMTSSK